ncbi:YicC/YloC family endoribonuclease [uncultured Thalassolituus sp.]|uniref:YicC/YloC family endoribonuclease n=1 Tax=uncultured Thalassolituus sp. TaxID=285273 RepID=UPI00262A2FA1|nr:YicC/YloC family endoribonuclease [uncultured Thalassolituus sp.]
MVRSMTAFARQNADTEQGRFTWEIRSVNSRYLELHFRLPDDFRDLEPILRDTLKKRLNRGKVEVFLRFHAANAAQGLSVNAALVEALNQAADQVHAIIGPGNALDALRILEWPGVLEGAAIDTKAIQTSALTAFGAALSELITAREREGESLAALIQQRCEECQALSIRADSLMPEAIAAQREHLQKKLDELLDNPDTERLEQEIVLLAQKADIAEETDRLRTHIDEVQAILSRDEPIGRRLDFMMQELNREANTLSSKAIRTDLTRIAVDLKVLIEQMREQVQNIE